MVFPHENIVSDICFSVHAICPARLSFQNLLITSVILKNVNYEGLHHVVPPPPHSFYIS